MIKAILNRHGHTVIEVEDGKRALDIITGDTPIDLIISDFKMPHLDGIALLEELKKREIAIPFILLSAYIDDGEHAAKAGVHYFLPKPFAYRDLIHAIEHAANSADV